MSHNIRGACRQCAFRIVVSRDEIVSVRGLSHVNTVFVISITLIVLQLHAHQDVRLPIADSDSASRTGGEQLATVCPHSREMNVLLVSPIRFKSRLHY